MAKYFLTLVALAATTLGCGQSEQAAPPPAQSQQVVPITDEASSTVPLIETYEKGEIVYCLSDWTHAFNGPKWTIEERCEVAKRLGIQLDLVSVADQEVVDRYPDAHNLCVLPGMGLKPNGDPYDPFEIGFNSREHWPRVKAGIDEAIDHAAKHKIPFVIVFTGMRDPQLSEEEQLENLVVGFRTVVGHAEEHGVFLALEMLNTRVAVPMKGHPGYLGDSTEFTAEVVKRVNSPNLGLVFDFYHMQIMGEDPGEMIRKYGQLVRYTHVAGAFRVVDDPEAVQRAELNRDRQMVDYPAIVGELKKSGYGGPLSFEYVPTTNDGQAAEANLAEAKKLCGG